MDEHSRTSPPSFEEYPLTRQEYISAMVHLYRGEMYRSQIWRQRLDTTTNWAVVTTAAVVSFSFGDPAHAPVVLLLANLVVVIFLFTEARRYRHFAVYQARVRMLEENFFLPLLTRHLQSPMRDWNARMATDLDQPCFKTTMSQAVAFRLTRNYFWVFLILFLSWILKLFVHPTRAASFAEIYERMAVGPLPSWAVLLAALAFLGTAGAFAAGIRGGAPVEEIRGLAPDLERWQI